MKIPVQSQPIMRSAPGELIVEAYDLMKKSSQLQASVYIDCRGLVIGRVGRSPWKSNAKRNARRKWRYDVRRQPLLGGDFANWDWANKPVTSTGEIGYACSKKWWGWRCSAWAYPCVRY